MSTWDGVDDTLWLIARLTISLQPGCGRAIIILIRSTWNLGMQTVASSLATASEQVELMLSMQKYLQKSHNDFMQKSLQIKICK